MEYTIVRSSRRSISMEVKAGGQLIVRAPRLMPQFAIDSFVNSHRDWIEKSLKKQSEKDEMQPIPLTRDDIKLLRKKALEILPKRVAYYADIMGLAVPNVKITSARTRYGSCSARNNISFSRYLMVNDPDSIDYVVVHELSHIRNKNHSRKFWNEVASVLPDYKQRQKKLFMPRIEEDDIDS